MAKQAYDDFMALCGEDCIFDDADTDDRTEVRRQKRQPLAPKEDEEEEERSPSECSPPSPPPGEEVADGVVSCDDDDTTEAHSPYMASGSCSAGAPSSSATSCAAAAPTSAPVPEIVEQSTPRPSSSSTSSFFNVYDTWQPAEAQRRHIGEEELEEIRTEAAVARELGMKWKERGPPAPDQGGPDSWRGQQWRQGSGRWANRGGKNAAWYTAYYKAKAQGPEAVKRFLDESGKGSGKDKGSGKGKDKGKSVKAEDESQGSGDSKRGWKG